ncbi:hypothetical protein BV379_20735 [Rhodovulum sulfidophilum]|nr:hypothetical protein BV379_20735 [Rhodovulum sulfidophilum]
MSSPTSRSCKTLNWLSYNGALKRRDSLTIWFDLEVSWEAVPTGKRGQQQTYSDAAIQTYLAMEGEGRPANTGARNGASGERSTSGSTSKFWRTEPSSSPAVASATPPCCRNCSIRSHPNGSVAQIG